MTDMPRLHDAYRAQARIRGLVSNTPLIAADELARQSGAGSVLLKLDCLQPTGAFKVRGAANKILGLSPAERRCGVITFSTGNHGTAVAYVAAQSGVRAVVCLSEHVPPYRVQRIRDLGAEVSVAGRSQDEAEQNYLGLMQSRGLVPVVPFDDPAIIAGQGTIALELLAARPDIDTLLVPLSGGGLLAGIAMVAKTIDPHIRVIGLSLERSPAMVESVKAGVPVTVPEKDSIADSLLGGIGVDNRYTLPLVRRYVDEHLLLSEREIEDGMCYLFDRHRLIVEGAAALGVGALLHARVAVRGRRVATVLSGSTIDTAAYARLIHARFGNGREAETAPRKKVDR